MALEVAASTFPFLYSKSGLDSLRHLQGLGYKKFELMIFPPHCWPADLSASETKEYKAWLDGEGTSITSLCYPLIDNNPNAPDRLMRQYTIDRYREAVDLSAELSCPYVVMIPGPYGGLIDPPTAWLDDWFVESAQAVVEHAKGAGVRILLENVPFTHRPTAQDMKELCEKIGDVGVNFDVCNSVYIKEDAGDAIRMLGDLVENVHLSDTPADVFKHEALGTGIVDPAPTMQALKDIGYDKMTVLEIIADANDPANDPDGDYRKSHAILADLGWSAL
ncbi:sugar phosphate isomerase/epimerase family protein [Histidinibacterium aquaticum]|uniref:Sugar phosphate isomerase/epimerase n=1 Tax=Histidinibacterium aquaticum TaxID=2613962 RepID=A0A5J5GLB9_9RHOB|nr:sugar phosphate isomerase/epimerase family protein [Histidinibacterium aquaticum]KAA9008817.1 sugar phosphate isomerase/epimerase [Histidinibacterium aquaticum]